MTLVTRGIRHDYKGRVERLRRKMVDQNLDSGYV